MEDEEFKKLVETGKNKLIMDTMKYTKKQIQWIRNRIISNSSIDIIKNRLFKLEFSDVD